MKNKVRQIRNRLDLSQQQLAEAAATSQQQIQRIETHKTAPRLQLAISISKALQQPLDVVFPGSAKAIKEINAELETGYLPESKTYEKAAASGIEADPRIWYLKILLRGHDGELFFRIDPSEYRRLFSAVQREDQTGTPFVVFDTDEHRIAVNLRDLVYCQFLFEPGDVLLREGPTNDEDEDRAKIYFCGMSRCFEFGVEEDRGSPHEEDDPGDFRHIFYILNTFVEDHERLRFQDEDGEDVFLRVGDIALLQVPRWVIDPDAFEEYLRRGALELEGSD